MLLIVVRYPADATGQVHTVPVVPRVCWRSVSGQRIEYWMEIVEGRGSCFHE